MLGNMGKLAIALVLLALVPNAAAAKITAGDIIGADISQESSTDASGARLGGYVSCAGGQRVLTGGAYWHQSGTGGNYQEADNAYLASSTVTKDAKGWYADGFHRYPIVSMDFTLFTLCVGKHQVKGSTLVGKTVKVNDHFEAHAKARCPRGTEVLTGGAFFHAKGEPPNPEEGGTSRTTASMPLASGGGWYAAGSTGYGEGSVLTVRARCLASKRVAPVKFVKETLIANDSENTGGVVACPGDRVPLTGGAYFRKANKGLARSVGAGNLGSSVLTGVPSGWYATGQSAGDGHRFTTVIRCLGGGG